MLDGGLAKPRDGGRAEGVAGLLSSCYRHYSTTRGPPQNFKGEYLKLNLKFYICAPITLGVVDVTLRNFTR